MGEHDRVGQPALRAGAAPASYEELFSEYHGMVLGMAASMGISSEDLEDAAAEVELRFWKKDGLSWYDPEMQHAPPAGGWRDGSAPKPRPARFGGMYRRWVHLNMRQEVDRHSNRTNRVRPTPDDQLPELPTLIGPESSVCESDTARDWLEKAEWTLHRTGNSHLLSALYTLACSALGDSYLTRQQLGATVGISAGAASKQARALRTLLTEHGLGPESLAS